jgi:hypothetical protein
MEEQDTARRPRVVLIALCLLSFEVSLSVLNLFALSPQADPLGPHINYHVWRLPLMLALYGVGMVLIYRITAGSSWARWTYLGIFLFVVARAIETGLELGTAFDALATHNALPPPSDADYFDSRSYPGLFGLVMEEWRIIVHLIVLVQALLLSVSMFLLFTPTANRWYISRKRRQG